MDLSLGVCWYGLELRWRHCCSSPACPLHCKRREGNAGLVRSLKGGGNGNDGSGDPNLQQKLVDIIRLETGKVRVSDYIQEKSKLLSDIAEQAIVESDRIAADALKDFDEASAKTIKAVDEGIQAVEEQLAFERAEEEARQEELEAYEKRVQDARSEGLFFKGLYKPSKPWKDRTLDEQKALKREARQIARATKTLLRSKSRQNLYIFLMFILGLFLVEGVTSMEFSLPRILVYAAVILLLSVQLIFEKVFSSEKQDTRERK